ncbi:hypothetical protein Slala02_30960 [Streptomyces lavendulae subsp. lavendulae]|nr:hypothetical protein Slala01_34240 [Streptomyces lavendulae subsp. lavendulae]GLX27276.1 hypothetical protein Slala02_30960 [Streptomyces lavendulae subsp. lavendulae]
MPSPSREDQTIERHALAASATPSPHTTAITWQGRILLRFIGLVQAKLARHPFRPDVALRNASMRAAHRRGVSKSDLIRVTGLTAQTIAKALAGKPTAD